MPGFQSAISAITDEFLYTLAFGSNVQRRENRRRFGGGFVFGLDRIKDFLAVDLDVPGGVNAKTHLIAPYFYDGDGDLIANHDFFVELSGKYKHPQPLSPIEEAELGALNSAMMSCLVFQR